MRRFLLKFFGLCGATATNATIPYPLGYCKLTPIRGKVSNMARKSVATSSERRSGATNGGLRLDPESKAQILARLHRVEGQVHAIAGMIEQERDCLAIAHQMGAAKSALERATVTLMATSLIQCIKPGRNGEVDQKELSRLTDTFVKILS